MKSSLVRSLVVSFAIACHSAAARPPSPSTDFSIALSTLPAVVVSGSLEAAAASGEMVVAGLQTTGEVSLVVLRGAADSAAASVEVSAQVARDLGLAVGSVIEVSAERTGFALLSAGAVVAYVPNELGRALLRHSRVD